MAASVKQNILAFLALSACSCANNQIQIIPKNDIPYGIVSVKVSDTTITQKFGTYHKNVANEWSSIGNVISRNRFINKIPKITIRTDCDTLYKFWLIKLDQESSYRYFYVSTTTEYHAHRSPNEIGAPLTNPIKCTVKHLSYGIWEVQPSTPLECGEYAIMKPLGLNYSRDNFKTYDAYVDNVQTWVSGVLWDFGIDD